MLSALVEMDIEDKRARAAERAKAVSPGGSGSALPGRAVHPMLVSYPAQLADAVYGGDLGASELAKIDDSTMAPPVRAQTSATR